VKGDGGEWIRRETKTRMCRQTGMHRHEANCNACSSARCLSVAP
jgi:hypothetical protein